MDKWDWTDVIESEPPTDTLCIGVFDDGIYPDHDMQMRPFIYFEGYPNTLSGLHCWMELPDLPPWVVIYGGLKNCI